jgi:hypothetical protein
MIPNIPILELPKRRAGISSAFYDPNSLILKIDKESDLENFIEYNSILIHEWTHWIQHNGTSFGAFLHAMKFAQYRTTLTWLRELPDRTIIELLNKRKAGKSPIVSINKITNQLEHQTYPSHTNNLQLFSQVWFDLQWVYSIFNDSRIAFKTHVPDGQVFGDTIGDVFLHFYYSANNHSQSEILESRKWYQFKNNEIGFLKIGEDHLTSTVLLECGATISELQFLLNNSENPISKFIHSEHLNRRIESLLNTNYGIPIRLFFNEYAMDYENLPSICDTINVLIFIALNPPVPPFQIGPPDNGISWSWQDIYPPIRYFRAMKSIEKIGLLSPNSNHKETKEYIKKILQETNLPIVLDTILLTATSFKNIDFDSKNNKYDPNNIQFDGFDYTYWVQKKFATLKIDSLPFIVNFSNCLHGDLSKKYLDLLLFTDEISFSHIPFVWTKNDKIGFRGNVDFNNSLLRSVAMDYSFFDVAAGIGNYDLSAFSPQVGSSQRFVEFIDNQVYTQLVKIKNN